MKEYNNDSAYSESDPEYDLPKTGKRRGRPPGSSNKKPAAGRATTRQKYHENRPKQVRQDKKSYYIKKK